MAAKEAEKLSGDVADKNGSCNKMSTQCFRHGKSSHIVTVCFHKKSKCQNCQEIGHLGRMCQKKGKAQAPIGETPTEQRGKIKKKTSKLNKLAGEDVTGGSKCSDDENFEEWPVYTMFAKSEDKKEIKVKVNINNCPINMELDTGSSVSLISQSLYNNKFKKSAPLKSSSIVLRTYTGQAVPVLGEFTAEVQYESQRMKLPLLVVGSEGPALFGRNWLHELWINWRDIHHTIKGNAPNMKELSRSYLVFNGKLGTVKGITATLKIKEVSQPKFFKPRPVPIAQRNKIATEMLRLEKEGVVEKVESSEWATPIVPVLKPDDTVRICGDYKIHSQSSP